MDHGINAPEKKKAGSPEMRSFKFKYFVGTFGSHFKKLTSGRKSVMLSQENGIVIVKVPPEEPLQIFHLSYHVFGSAGSKILTRLHSTKTAVIETSIRHDDRNDVVVHMPGIRRKHSDLSPDDAMQLIGSPLWGFLIVPDDTS
jgi:hypothetical protein